MRVVVLTLSVLISAVLFGPMPTFGQEAKAKSGGAVKAAAPQFTEKDWPELVARKQEFLKRVDALKEEFESAKDDESKQKLITQFRAIQQEFATKVQPGLRQLASKIYANDPTDVDAAEVVISQSFQENKYAQVIEMVEQVFGAGHKQPALLTFLGVSQFATHDFANARKSLTEASDVDKNVFPALGGPFLAASEGYAGLWKEEQAIRAKEQAANDLPQVRFQTSKGDIDFELFENEAPNTVANFVSLVEQKKYDGISFHRVIPTFMAQGGDPNTLDDDPQNDGQGGPGYRIRCECYNDNARMHFQGSLSMAHAGKDSGGSQFFITHLPTPHLNPNAAQQRGHTVFGRVADGMDVALALRIGDKIESAKVLRKREHAYEPETLADSRRAPPEKKSPAKK